MEKTSARVELLHSEQKIYLIRGHKVMLDSDLAPLYGVTTFNLNKAVKRNIRRFPQDFMFRLTRVENQALTFHIGISKAPGRGGRRHLPYVFTEHGVAMLSSVLHSERAIRVNIQIMRAFARLREILSANRDLSRRLDDLEKKYDKQFVIVFHAIRELRAPEEPPRRRIGFHREKNIDRSQPLDIIPLTRKTGSGFPGFARYSLPGLKYSMDPYNYC